MFDKINKKHLQVHAKSWRPLPRGDPDHFRGIRANRGQFVAPSPLPTATASPSSRPAPESAKHPAGSALSRSKSLSRSDSRAHSHLVSSPQPPDPVQQPPPEPVSDPQPGPGPSRSHSLSRHASARSAPSMPSERTTRLEHHADLDPHSTLSQHSVSHAGPSQPTCAPSIYPDQPSAAQAEMAAASQQPAAEHLPDGPHHHRLRSESGFQSHPTNPDILRARQEAAAEAAAVYERKMEEVHKAEQLLAQKQREFRDQQEAHLKRLEAERIKFEEEARQVQLAQQAAERAAQEASERMAQKAAQRAAQEIAARAEAERQQKARELERERAEKEQQMYEQLEAERQRLKEEAQLQLEADIKEQKRKDEEARLEQELERLRLEDEARARQDAEIMAAERAKEDAKIAARVRIQERENALRAHHADQQRKIESLVASIQPSVARALNPVSYAQMYSSPTLYDFSPPPSPPLPRSPLFVPEDVKKAARAQLEYHEKLKLMYAQEQLRIQQQHLEREQRQHEREQRPIGREQRQIDLDHDSAGLDQQRQLEPQEQVRLDHQRRVEEHDQLRQERLRLLDAGTHLTAAKERLAGELMARAQQKQDDLKRLMAQAAVHSRSDPRFGVDGKVAKELEMQANCEAIVAKRETERRRAEDDVLARARAALEELRAEQDLPPADGRGADRMIPEGESELELAASKKRGAEAAAYFMAKQALAKPFRMRKTSAHVPKPAPMRPVSEHRRRVSYTDTPPVLSAGPGGAGSGLKVYSMDDVPGQAHEVLRDVESSAIIDMGHTPPLDYLTRNPEGQVRFKEGSRMALQALITIAEGLGANAIIKLRIQNPVAVDNSRVNFSAKGVAVYVKSPSREDPQPGRRYGNADISRPSDSPSSAIEPGLASAPVRLLRTPALSQFGDRSGASTPRELSRQSQLPSMVSGSELPRFAARQPLVADGTRKASQTDTRSADGAHHDRPHATPATQADEESHVPGSPAADRHVNWPLTDSGFVSRQRRPSDSYRSEEPSGLRTAAADCSYEKSIRTVTDLYSDFEMDNPLGRSASSTSARRQSSIPDSHQATERQSEQFSIDQKRRLPDHGPYGAPYAPSHTHPQQATTARIPTVGPPVKSASSIHPPRHSEADRHTAPPVSSRSASRPPSISESHRAEEQQGERGTHSLAGQHSDHNLDTERPHAPSDAKHEPFCASHDSAVEHHGNTSNPSTGLGTPRQTEPDKHTGPLISSRSVSRHSRTSDSQRGEGQEAQAERGAVDQARRFTRHSSQADLTRDYSDFEHVEPNTFHKSVTEERENSRHSRSRFRSPRQSETAKRTGQFVSSRSVSRHSRAPESHPGENEESQAECGPVHQASRITGNGSQADPSRVSGDLEHAVSSRLQYSTVEQREKPSHSDSRVCSPRQSEMDKCTGRSALSRSSSHQAKLPDSRRVQEQQVDSGIINQAERGLAHDTRADRLLASGDNGRDESRASHGSAGEQRDQPYHLASRACSPRQLEPDRNAGCYQPMMPDNQRIRETHVQQRALDPARQSLDSSPQDEERPRSPGSVEKEGPGASCRSAAERRGQPSGSRFCSLRQPEMQEHTGRSGSSSSAIPQPRVSESHQVEQNQTEQGTFNQARKSSDHDSSRDGPYASVKTQFKEQSKTDKHTGLSDSAAGAVSLPSPPAFVQPRSAVGPAPIKMDVEEKTAVMPDQNSPRSTTVSSRRASPVKKYTPRMSPIQSSPNVPDDGGSPCPRQRSPTPLPLTSNSPWSRDQSPAPSDDQRTFQRATGDGAQADCATRRRSFSRAPYARFSEPTGPKADLASHPAGDGFPLTTVHLLDNNDSVVVTSDIPVSRPSTSNDTPEDFATRQRSVSRAPHVDRTYQARVPAALASPQVPSSSDKSPSPTVLSAMRTDGAREECKTRQRSASRTPYASFIGHSGPISPPASIACTGSPPRSMTCSLHDEDHARGRHGLESCAVVPDPADSYGKQKRVALADQAMSADIAGRESPHLAHQVTPPPIARVNSPPTSIGRSLYGPDGAEVRQRSVSRARAPVSNVAEAENLGRHRSTSRQPSAKIEEGVSAMSARSRSSSRAPSMRTAAPESRRVFEDWKRCSASRVPLPMAPREIPLPMMTPRETPLPLMTPRETPLPPETPHEQPLPCPTPREIPLPQSPHSLVLDSRFDRLCTDRSCPHTRAGSPVLNHFDRSLTSYGRSETLEHRSSQGSARFVDLWIGDGWEEAEHDLAGLMAPLTPVAVTAEKTLKKNVSFPLIEFDPEGFPGAVEARKEGKSYSPCWDQLSSLG